jgi:hypothetical protein
VSFQAGAIIVNWPLGVLRELLSDVATSSRQSGQPCSRSVGHGRRVIDLSAMSIITYDFGEPGKVVPVPVVEMCSVFGGSSVR